MATPVSAAPLTSKITIYGWSTKSAGEWVRRFHPSPEAELRLVLFPHAGGSASYYFPFSQALAPDIEVLSLQYPGRQDRRGEECITSISELADRVYAELQPWTDGPFAFFGHSMGSILACEVAQRFQRRRGQEPLRLFASGYPAPSRLPSGTVHLRDEAGLVRELREVGGTDPQWLEDKDLLAAILPAVRGDYQAIETHSWEPVPPLDCPITMLVGNHDPHTSMEQAAAWQNHTTGEFTMQVFEGGHFYLENHRAEVVDTVSTALAKALSTLTADRSLS
ncbi:alpha/beta fold hydrolase [Kitasatospora kazusensis]|uniref:Alpha/beta fold hydrolase n=1 Tax=Kitasatospora kazusensis TaxID=407974 RepID=A0ABN1ZN67_9ACTN